MARKPVNQEIQEHIERAKEFGVSIEEYSEVYGVDLALLKGAEQDEPSLNDFVKVRFASDMYDGLKTVCSLRHEAGWTLSCHEWPPVEWLRSLGGAE